MPFEAKSLARNLLILKGLQTAHLPDRVASAGQVPKEFHKVAISYPATEFRPRLHTEDRVCNRKKDVYIDTGIR